MENSENKNQTNNTDINLDKFIEQLVKEKGLTNLEEEVLTQLKGDLRERLDDRINAVIVEKMPADKTDEFEKLLNNGTDEAVQAFCAQNIHNLDEQIAVVLLEFRNIYLKP